MKIKIKSATIDVPDPVFQVAQQVECKVPSGRPHDWPAQTHIITGRWCNMSFDPTKPLEAAHFGHWTYFTNPLGEPENHFCWMEWELERNHERKATKL